MATRMIGAVSHSGSMIDGLLALTDVRLAPGRGPRGPGEPGETESAGRRAPVDRVEVSDDARAAHAELTSEERAQVRRLAESDRAVRRHEQAHQSAGGHLAASPSFEYVTGPDGRRYAQGGEVQIDTAAVHGDPQATISKMQQVRRAALAPPQPSAQDRRVAAQAAAAERKARAELQQRKAETDPDAASERTRDGQPPSPDARAARAVAAYRDTATADVPAISLVA